MSVPALKFRGLADASPLPMREGPANSAIKGRVFNVRGWYRWGDRRKLAYLRNLSETYGRDPQFRHFVITNVIPGVQDRAYEQQATSLLRWVQTHIRYVNEPDEIIQSPWQTLKLGYGDCDDSATLLGAMATAIALPWKFVLAGVNRQTGTRVRFVEGEKLPYGVEFGHIYVSLGWPPFRPVKWAIAEPTVKGASLGRDVAMTTGVLVGGGAAAGLGSFGDAARFYGGMAVDDRIDVEEHPLVRVGRMVPWQDIAVAIISSLTVALLIKRWRL